MAEAVERVWRFGGEAPVGSLPCTAGLRLRLVVTFAVTNPGCGSPEARCVRAAAFAAFDLFSMCSLKRLMPLQKVLRRSSSDPGIHRAETAETAYYRIIAFPLPPSGFGLLPINCVTLFFTSASLCAHSGKCASYRAITRCGHEHSTTPSEGDSAVSAVKTRSS